MELRKHLYLSLKQHATLSVFKQQLKRLATSRSLCNYCSNNVRESALRLPKRHACKSKLQFEGFDNATQPQKPHWESVAARLCFSFLQPFILHHARTLCSKTKRGEIDVILNTLHKHE